MSAKRPVTFEDVRNVNILSFEMHNRWENGDRRNMRIYELNQLTIGTLQREYNEFSKIEKRCPKY